MGFPIIYLRYGIVERLRMKRIQVRSSSCLVCGMKFLGKVDDTGRFCSLRCKIKLPVEELQKLVIKKQSISYKVVNHKEEQVFRKGKLAKKNRLISELQKELAASRIENSRLKESKFVGTSKKVKIRKPDKFLDSDAWRSLRYRAIKLYGRTCMCCKRTNIEIHVDHIKPRSKYPHLALDINNLQILCRDCNLGKSNTDEIDYRDHKNIAILM